MKIPRKKFQATVPSVAMGDIAFNLLIFFVILARAQDDSHIKWEPASTPKVEQVKNVGVSVVIDTENKLYLNGQEIGESQLSGAIEKLLGNAPAGKRSVLLKVHREVTALRFEPVIEAVSQAGGDLVHILEEKSVQPKK
jgi:biopolymer transport protein ExbD